jgi:hypothetical protein
MKSVQEAFGSGSVRAGGRLQLSVQGSMRNHTPIIIENRQAATPLGTFCTDVPKGIPIPKTFRAAPFLLPLLTLSDRPEVEESPLCRPQKGRGSGAEPLWVR